MIGSRIPALLLLLAAVPLSTLNAQFLAARPDTSHQQSTLITGKDAPHPTLFTAKDAALAAAFAGVTVAMFPADKSIARRLTNERSKANKFLNRSSKGVELIADPGSLVIGAGLYLFGRYTNHPAIADLGWHGTEAVVLGSSITWMLKGVTGRARPLVSADTSPHDFRFGKGFGGGDRASFPSGHTTAAFAAASAVTSEAHNLWPGHDWLVGPAMYGGATLVGLSRMYHDLHWASDVVLGAAIGTFSGLKVVRYTHLHPDNRLDRIMLRTSVAPDGQGGAMVYWVVPLAH